jgi:Holliday junction resolvasome RuvABC endonuclease subunit
MTNTILALDLGTTMGWAISDNTTISSGTVSFKNQRFEGGGMTFLRFKQWFTEMKNTVGGIDAVYFEEVRRHISTDSAHKYGGFMAHLTALCEHHEIPYRGVPVGTIKKHITGKGNASKQDMIDAVKAKGFFPVDDNEADALALLDLALKEYC